MTEFPIKQKPVHWFAWLVSHERVKVLLKQNSIAAYKYTFEADNKSAPLICWNVTINAPELPRFSTFQCVDS